MTNKIPKCYKRRGQPNLGIMNRGGGRRWFLRLELVGRGFSRGSSLLKLSKLGRWEGGGLWKCRAGIGEAREEVQAGHTARRDTKKEPKAREFVRNGNLGRDRLCLLLRGILVFFTWSPKLDTWEKSQEGTDTVISHCRARHQSRGSNNA